jgi:hypothetical protein
VDSEPTMENRWQDCGREAAGQVGLCVGEEDANPCVAME